MINHGLSGKGFNSKSAEVFFLIIKVFVVENLEKIQEKHKNQKLLVVFLPRDHHFDTYLLVSVWWDVDFRQPDCYSTGDLVLCEHSLTSVMQTAEADIKVTVL